MQVCKEPLVLPVASLSATFQGKRGGVGVFFDRGNVGDDYSFGMADCWNSKCLLLG